MEFLQAMLTTVGGVEAMMYLSVMIVAVAAGCGWQGRIK